MSTWDALQQRKKLHNKGNNRNQFCNVKDYYYIIGEINLKQYSDVM